MIGYPYYNQTIKQAVSVFGSLFNNIVLKRKDGKLIPVPIAYGPRDKWKEAHKAMDPKEEMFEKLLPRMSYEVVAMNYDQVRKLTNSQKLIGKSPNGKFAQRIAAPVPYNLDFSLYIQTKNLNDGWQIIEQILPFFTPSYTVKVRHYPADNDSDSPIMMNEYDMPFTMLAVTWADDWTGSIDDRRIIEWTLEFQTKIWMHAPAAASGTGKVILDSRAIVAYTDDIQGANRNDPSNQQGEEIGWAYLDSDSPVFDNDSVISPSIINTIDSDGNIVKIIRDVEIF